MAYRALKWIAKALFPKMRVEGLENIPAGGAVIVGNHAHAYGPVGAELYLGSNRYTWCAAEMMNLKEVPAYAFQDFWSMKPRYTHLFFKMLSYLAAPLSVLIFNNANTVPVYHDVRVMKTFRETLRLLREGKNIVVFPEHVVPRNNIVYDFQDRFIDLGRMYYNLTQKELSFVPMYIAPRLKKIILGKPIRYRSDAFMDQERRRIKEELMEAVTALGRSQPRHIVIPYAVIPQKDYPFNRDES
ncbi:MAG: 1-acyl-sn-glycerol-3-phosphate acyltransferase [Clostridia bacterium]|nr:1-acyl-sn-glycerol-3-phosphate acyltransferase [Clostridia bacterium]